MTPWKRFSIAISLLLLSPGPVPSSRAGETPHIAFLLSAENVVYRKLVQGLQGAVKGTTKEIVLKASGDAVLNAIRDFRPDLVVAVGDAAAIWAKQKLPDTPMVACGIVFQANAQALQGVPGVSLDFSPAAYFRLVKDAVPEVRRVGLLVGTSMATREVQSFKRAAEDLGLSVNIQLVQKEKAVGQAMQALKIWGAQAFMLTFDPLIMNPHSWQYLVGFAVTNHMALVVPSRSLLKSGGLLSLEADYPALGRQAGEIVNRAVADQGRVRELGLAHPAAAEIGINLKMADVVGLQIHPAIRKRAHYVHE
jgi:ABC-type uncharacterized transport system substrate-binding protein